MHNKNLKTIFITGGVVSSLGKGISASILSSLLINRGYKVKLKKIDPYLNVDPGTLNPAEHGEVYVTNDGVETDLDLGHYERLGEVVTSKSDYITSGQIYQTLITKERNGEYNGKTVQLIPHFTSELKYAIFQATDDVDFLICEVGGTVGDLENNSILETIRQIKLNNKNVINLHVALIPFLNKAQEWKTKPVQHSLQELLRYGISADILLCRMESKNHDKWKEKLSLLCNIQFENIFEALDAKTIYHALANYESEGVCKRVLDIFQLPQKDLNLSFLNNYLKVIDSNLPVVNIAICGKYIDCKDAYKSIEESLQHAGFANKVHVNITVIDVENYSIDELKNIDGILIPGGFGKRAIDGKITAVNFARKNNIPMLGICLGLQVAIIDGLRDLYQDADSTEFNPNTKNPVILKMEEWQKDNSSFKPKNLIGGTMRLGAYDSVLVANTLTYSLYGSEIISERHRHRYIFNNNYKNDLEKVGITVSAMTNDDDNFVEIIERKDCKFFIAAQFHAEFKSTIKNPHPLFVGFVKACIS